MMAVTLALVLLHAALPQPAAAQRAPSPVPAYPFGVGETLVYDAKLGFVTLGSGRLEVARMDTVRGTETFLFRFRLQGKAAFYEIDDVLESWVATADFTSRRFRQDYDEGGKERLREFEIFPDSGYYRQLGLDTTFSTPTNPLDDTAFFYFIRMVPLEVGKRYSYNRYFKEEKNPVTIRVLERESLEMPDGSEVECLVLNPVIDTRGMFSKRSNTKIWVTDDTRRLPVQIRSGFGFGTVTLRLREILPPVAAPAAASRTR